MAKRLQPSTTDGELLRIVQGVIAASLASGTATIAEAAVAAGLSVRGLQRRLAKHGMTYSQLREKVRCDTAFRLIDDRRLRLSEIASALGYSDPAHFTRAFVRWYGVPPRAYRNRAARASPDRSHRRKTTVRW